MSYAETARLANIAKVIINPATEDKQDVLHTDAAHILAELQLKADLTDTQPVSLVQPAGSDYSKKTYIMLENIYLTLLEIKQSLNI